jgi:RNA polymerase sigma-70 factor (ECF subfamily)
MEQSPTNQSDQEMSKRLMLLMVQHQRQIFSFIYSLAPDRHDAEDLLQETSLVICEKFVDFKPGTNFLAWACQIALWRVRAARQKFARSRIAFDDETLQRVATTSISLQSQLDDRHHALAGCLEKLPAREREFVMTRYQAGGSVADAARQSGRSLEAAYKALARIRKVLFDCVNRQLATEAVT